MTLDLENLVAIYVHTHAEVADDGHHALPDVFMAESAKYFKTSDGPDVKVWLSVNPASKAEGARDAKYVDLGDLKGTVGNQNYPVPAAAADQTWGSVVIWCDRFSVPFGAADLKPAPPTTR